MSVWTNVRVSGETLDALKEFRLWLEYSVSCTPSRFPAWLRENPRISLADTVRYLIEKSAPKGGNRR